MSAKPDTAASCPDIESLELLAAGEVPAVSQGLLLDHLSGCVSCRRAVSRLGAWDEELRELIQAGKPARLLRWNLRKTAAAAAAVLVLATAAVAAFVRYRDGETLVTPAGRSIEEARDEVHGERTVRLTDGTLLRFGKDAEARFLSPADGERHHLRLASGTVEVEAAKGGTGLRVSAEGGEVRILGTRFRVRAFTLRLPGEGPLSCLCATVSEGKVEVRNPDGRVPIGAGERGLSVAGYPPQRQENRLDLADILRVVASHLEKAGDGYRISPGREREVLLSAATYWGASEGEAATEEAAGKEASDPKVRAAWGVLESLRKSREESGE